MPEGDTLFRLAQRLRPRLVGEPLHRIESPRLRGPRPRIGDTFDSVEASGKYLVMGFSGGLSIVTHLGMNGSWRLHRSDRPWNTPRHLLALALWTPEWVAVCSNASVARSHPTARSGGPEDPTARLGPDLCRPEGSDEAAIDEVLSNMEALAGDVTLGAALLDQRVVAGIGNIYKNEVCWFVRVHPDTPLGSVTPQQRRAALDTAARLLQANLGSGPRRTVPGGFAVYGRRGRPCRRCGTRIESRGGATAGDDTGDGRLTFWCPTCQPAPRG